MWFDSVVFLKTAARQQLCKLYSLSLYYRHLFLPLLITMSRSHLLCHSGPSVPHIIISENTHTAHALYHRWVAWSLSCRWIGKYLLSQIVFLPLSSFHPSTSLLSSLHFHATLLSFFRALLSHRSRLHLITEGAHRHLLCKHAHILVHIFLNVWLGGWLYVYGKSYTRMHIWGISKQRVDNNGAEDNGVFYET